jgi:phosphoribosylformylglycinamidine synthase PurS subunit
VKATVTVMLKHGVLDPQGKAIAHALHTLGFSGVGEVRARPSLPASMFSSDDLPTFERPMKANSGSDSSGHESRPGALQSKMADEMFTMETSQPIVAANRSRRYNQFPPRNRV